MSTQSQHVSERDLLELLAGDTAPERLADVATHAARCSACAGQLVSARSLDAALSALSEGGAFHVQRLIYASPVGPLAIEATPAGISAVRFSASGAADVAAYPVLTEAVRQLEEYFAGRRRVFDVPLDLRALAPFQRDVLAATSAVPAGQTTTYGSVAGSLGRPRAARAVGGALNRNPLPIFIPCHRVVGGDGRLVGYAGGLPVKEALLRLEGALAA